MSVGAGSLRDRAELAPGGTPVHVPTRRKRRARWWGGLALLCILLAVALTTVALWPAQHSRGPAAGGTSVASLTSGMHLGFSGDFPGTTLDTGTWGTCYSWAASGSGCTNYGNSELQWYLPSQAQVSGGTLHLVASQEPTAGKAGDGSPMTYPWRSGMVTTYPSFAFTYGVVDIRARLAPGDGMWSALWMLPRSGASSPEIDIAESWGDTPSYIQMVSHPAQGQKKYTDAPCNCVNSWHTYTLDWEPSSLTWYIDGVQKYRVTGSGIPSEPMYVLANLAVANYPSTHPTSSTPRQVSMEIGRVAIYQH